MFNPPFKIDGLIWTFPHIKHPAKTTNKTDIPENCGLVKGVELTHQVAFRIKSFFVSW